jgi:hypothetical protein
VYCKPGGTTAGAEFITGVAGFSTGGTEGCARWMTTAATTSPKITHFTGSTSTNLPKYQKLHDSTYLEGNSVAESDSCSLIFLHLSIFIRFAIKLSGQFSMRQID